MNLWDTRTESASLELVDRCVATPIPPSSGGTFLIHTPLPDTVHLRIEVQERFIPDMISAQRASSAVGDVDVAMPRTATANEPW